MTWPAVVPRIALRTQLAGLVPQFASLTPTVGDPAATRSSGDLPAGFDHTEVSVDLPRGSFDTAAAAVLTLAMHRKSGLLTSQSSAVTVGETVLVGVPVGPLVLVVPCRVTWVIGEGAERGFGYATLPGHPEAGEESFIVSRDDTGAITFTVRAFSRPAGLARLGAPIGRRAAKQAIRKYLAAMVELTA